jgi:hypothetical protein
MKRKSIMEIKILGDVWENTQGDFEKNMGCGSQA